MKLRLVASAIRLRVTRSELARLANGDEVVEEQLVLGDTSFSWSLRVHESPAVEAGLLATEAGTRLEIRYPAQLAQAWLHGADVSLSANISFRGADPDKPSFTTLLIEKDFQCLVPRGEELHGDHFPHPAANPATED